MSGFGQAGPHRELAAHGFSADLAAGLVNLEERDGKRVFPDAHIPISPRLAGLNAAIAIMGSLVGKRATGEGEYLDVAQYDSAVVFGFRDLIHFANNGTRGQRKRRMASGSRSVARRTARNCSSRFRNLVCGRNSVRPSGAPTSRSMHRGRSWTTEVRQNSSPKCRILPPGAPWRSGSRSRAR